MVPTPQLGFSAISEVTTQHCSVLPAYRGDGLLRTVKRLVLRINSEEMGLEKFE
jgi:hypothetical protein